MCDDVVTARLSFREAIEVAGNDVLAGATLVDRSNGNADIGMPLHPLIRLAVPSCAADAIPPIKPGSRAK